LLSFSTEKLHSVTQFDYCFLSHREKEARVTPGKVQAEGNCCVLDADRDAILYSSLQSLVDESGEIGMGIVHYEVYYGVHNTSPNSIHWEHGLIPAYTVSVVPHIPTLRDSRGNRRRNRVRGICRSTKCEEVRSRMRERATLALVALHGHSRTTDGAKAAETRYSTLVSLLAQSVLHRGKSW
jgi:hypothetical protein